MYAIIRTDSGQPVPLEHNYNAEQANRIAADYKRSGNIVIMVYHNNGHPVPPRFCRRCLENARYSIRLSQEKLH